MYKRIYIYITIDQIIQQLLWTWKTKLILEDENFSIQYSRSSAAKINKLLIIERKLKTRKLEKFYDTRVNKCYFK